MASESRYDALLEHISGLIDGSVTEFDRALSSHCIPELATISREQGQTLAGLAYQALRSATSWENVSGISSLLQVLIPFFSFEDILKFDPPIDLVEGLQHQVEPFRGLTLGILEVAAKSQKSVRELVSSKPELLRELLRFWLTTESVSQAENASRVLVRMLRTDIGTSGIVEGFEKIAIANALPQGCPVWTELFATEETFSIIPQSCTKGSAGETPSRAQASIARGRLMDWIPEVALLNWYAVSQATVKSPTSKHLSEFPGLVRFAIQDIMTSDDPLSALLAIKCLVGLLRAREETPAESNESSLALLRSIGIHDKLVNMYLQDKPGDSLETQLLLPAAADYVGNFLRQYPDLFIGPNATEQKLMTRILEMMSKDFNLSLSQWAMVGQAEQYAKVALHLEVIQCIPRTGLLHKLIPGNPPRAVTALVKIPVASHCAGALIALGNIFHGPASALPPDSQGAYNRKPSVHVDADEETTAARNLYMAYLGRQQGAWRAVVDHAGRALAHKHLIFGALSFIRDVVAATWVGVRNDEEAMTGRYPLTGAMAALQPGVFDKLVPYLLNRAPSNAQTVAGSGALRPDDPDHHTLHQLITERFAVLGLFERALERDRARFLDGDAVAAGATAPAEAVRIPAVLKQVRDRLKQGPWNAARERKAQVEVAAAVA